MLLDRMDSLVLVVDVQEKLTPFVFEVDTLIARCEWILKLAKKMEVPIIASEQYPKGLGSTIKQLLPYFSEADCISKVHFSCMQQPDFITRLRNYNKNQLVITGIEAHVCVLQSALEIKDAGFDVYVVVDAVSSRSPKDLKYALKRMQQAGINLVTAEMVFFEWIRQAGTPDFKALSKEFLQ